MIIFILVTDFQDSCSIVYLKYASKTCWQLFKHKCEAQPQNYTIREGLRTLVQRYCGSPTVYLSWLWESVASYLDTWIFWASFQATAVGKDLVSSLTLREGAPFSNVVSISLGVRAASNLGKLLQT